MIFRELDFLEKKKRKRKREAIMYLEKMSEIYKIFFFLKGALKREKSYSFSDVVGRFEGKKGMGVAEDRMRI